MPAIREKIVALPPNPSTREIAGACLAKLKNYGKKYGSIHVGLSADPQKRFRQHNDRLTKPAAGPKADPWAKCVVIYRAVCDKKLKKIGRILIKWQKAEQGPEGWATINANGKKPNPGTDCAIYILLDKRPGLWKPPAPAEAEKPAAPQRRPATS